MITPGDKIVLFNLGNVNFELGNNPVAISWYTTCMSLDENWLPPLLKLANVHRDDRNYQDAIIKVAQSNKYSNSVSIKLSALHADYNPAKFDKVAILSFSGIIKLGSFGLLGVA